MMEAVTKCLQNGENALIQSPTGTGKTLCLLTSCLSWLAEQRKKNQKNNFKIIYCTRTHSQLKQIMKELKKTIYNPKTIILGSREKYCINDKVKYHEATKTLRTNIDKVCKYALNGQFGYECKNKKDIQEIQQNTSLEEINLRDIEDLVEISKEKKFCPYFYAKDSKQFVDLILVPYGYLLDRTISNKLMEEINEGLIIFDEAQNIQKLAEEGFSFEINYTQLQKVLQSLENLLDCEKYTEQFPFIEHVQCIEYLIELVDVIIKNLRKNQEVCQEKIQDDPLQFFLEHKGEVVNMFDAIFGSENKKKYLEKLHIKEIDEIINNIEQIQLNELAENGLGHFQHFLKGISIVNDQIKKNKSTNYIILLNLNPENKEFISFKLQNLDPSLAFKNIQQKGNFNFVITSGTLAPFDSWGQELKLEFQIILDNKHVIDADNQVKLSILENGPSYTQLNFTHEIRKNKKSMSKLMSEVGEVVYQACQIIPNGIVVVFASHSLQLQFIEKWNNISLFEKIEQHKDIFIEMQNQEIETLFLEYQEKALIDKKGAILLAVCRGRLIEGIDFSDKLARGVIMVGVPNMPPCTYINVKFEFLKKIESKLQGSDWFQQQTIRNMNQSIGRVIRHKDDYGCVILCDIRFNKYQNQFPKWINNVYHSEFEELKTDLIQFFKKWQQSKEDNKQLQNPKQFQEQYLEQDQESLFPNLSKESNKFEETDLYLPEDLGQIYQTKKVGQWGEQEIKQQKSKLGMKKDKKQAVLFDDSNFEEFPAFGLPSNSKKEEEKQNYQDIIQPQQNEKQKEVQKVVQKAEEFPSFFNQNDSQQNQKSIQNNNNNSQQQQGKYYEGEEEEFQQQSNKQKKKKNQKNQKNQNVVFLSGGFR